MPSVRLTIANREAIQAKVIGHKFDQLFNDLKKDKEAFAMELYNNIFTKKDRVLMDSLPDNFLPKREYVKVKFDSIYVSYECYNFGFDSSGNSIKKRVPYDMFNSVLASFTKEDKLTDKADALHKRSEELSASKQKAKREVMNILNSVTTISRLLAIWPEASDFILPYNSEGVVAQLPAIRIEEVNTLLGLPPKPELKVLPKRNDLAAKITKK